MERSASGGGGYLVINEGVVKSSLLGFYDPSPEGKKELYILYMHHKKVHKLVVGDDRPIKILAENDPVEGEVVSCISDDEYVDWYDAIEHQLANPDEIQHMPNSKYKQHTHPRQGVHYPDESGTSDDEAIEHSDNPDDIIARYR